MKFTIVFCKLGSAYIFPTSRIVKYPHFERILVKVQSGAESTLTNKEKDAARLLLKSFLMASNDSSVREAPYTSERVAKNRKTNCEASSYNDSGFILFSVAEVKHIWIMENYVLSDQRKRLTTQLFETLKFLCYNERF